MATVETAKDRRRLVEEAGRPSTSFVSILAGVLTAFGAVALVLAVAGAVGSQVGLTTEGISTSEWRQGGVAAAVAATVVVFLAFFLGGYTAGRMSRRAGLWHGVGVFVLGAVIVAVVVGLSAWLGDSDSLRDTLAENGVPTDANTWSDIGIGAAVAAGVAMLVGSLLGGVQGDRWHTGLLRAVVDRRATRDARDRPKHALGHDPTTVDVRDDHDGDRADHELSVEEERERQRTARSDVGL